MSTHRTSRLASIGPRLAAATARSARRLRTAWLVVPLVLAACVAPPPVKDPPVALFDDARFGPATQPIDPDDAMKLSPQMKRYIDEKIRPVAHRTELRMAMLEQLYAHSGLQLDYDATITRNASQAFDARSGNCLSLVLMTGAFAQALGLEVTYQQVTTDEIWSRAGNMYFMSGHVNLQLDRHFIDRESSVERFGRYTIDFMPSEQSATMRSKEISLRTVLAMYMNNRAAEAMVANQLDDAYWRVRDALRLDPSFMAAYNTLGVIYLRHHDMPQAEAALHAALLLQPDNPRIMGNYAQALHGVGRDADAKAYEARLVELEPYPPFYFFNQGRAALQAGNARAARDLFKKELRRDPDYHEFHYWLAVADFTLGEIDEARSELATALDDSVKRSDRDLYAAKLDRLKAYQAHTLVQ